MSEGLFSVTEPMKARPHPLRQILIAVAVAAVIAVIGHHFDPVNRQRAACHADHGLLVRGGDTSSGFVCIEKGKHS